MKQTAPESQIVNACIRWLWQHKCFVWRNNTGAYKPEGSNRYIRYGTPGGADIIGLTNSGHFIAVECKTAKGKLSPLQEAYRQHVEEHNGLYVLARSVDDLEARKTEILATHYPPGIARNIIRDYRVRPTSNTQGVDA